MFYTENSKEMTNFKCLEIRVFSFVETVIFCCSCCSFSSQKVQTRKSPSFSKKYDRICRCFYLFYHRTCPVFNPCRCFFCVRYKKIRSRKNFSIWMWVWSIWWCKKSIWHPILPCSHFVYNFWSWSHIFVSVGINFKPSRLFWFLDYDGFSHHFNNWFYLRMA